MLFLDYLPKLNTTELEIFHYIEANTEKIPYMTLREIAEETFVSPTAIWRFCKKFECDGYSEFKSRLKIFLAQRKQSIGYERFDETTLINFINKSTEESFEKLLLDASELIASKEFIFVLGYGRSSTTANYATIYFSTLHNLAFNMDPLLKNPTTIVSREFAEKSCMFILSVSGENDRILKNTSHFRSFGMKVISVTNSSKCTLASLSDINIPYYISTEKIKTADITSQIPAIFIVEKIAKYVGKIKRSEI